MSRDALYINNTGFPADAGGPRRLPRSGEYAALLRRLFRSHTALAVVGIGPNSRSVEAVKGIASELGSSGYRVVVVTAESLLRADAPSVTTGYRTGAAANVWFWPDGSDAPAGDFEDAQEPRFESDWLGYLCREFDMVLLDCPAIDTSPAAPEIAAMADAAVLVVEAGRTPKERIQHAQRTLELSGVKLAGSILMQRR